MPLVVGVCGDEALRFRSYPSAFFSAYNLLLEKGLLEQRFLRA